MGKRCIIYVFSGTGNTLFIAKQYAAMLSYETDICNIGGKDVKYPSPDDYDAAGIGYPVHAFNAPYIVRESARMLRTQKHIPLFIFHTGGEGLSFNDSSSFAIRGILRRNGFDILSEEHYVMPYNMIFRHSDAMVKHMVTKAAGIVKNHARKIEDEEKEKMKRMPLRHLISLILRIEWIYAHLQGRFMKADDRCTSCGLCAARCPVGNIEMVNGRPHFGTKCVLCVRCSFSCPHNAISIGLLNGWKVNGDYDIDRIMKDETIPAEIPLDKLSVLYRGYYRKHSEKE